MSKNKDNKLSLSDKALLGASGAVLGTGLSRKYFQTQASDKVLDVVGGSTATPTKGSLEFQRDAWAKVLSENPDYDVRTYASRLGFQNKGGKYFMNAPTLQRHEGLNISKPMAEIHTSKFDQNPLKLIARRVLKGQGQYRVLTDYGPGSLEQKSSGGWNMMKAHGGAFYTRYIVPGGDKFKMKSGQSPNINVNSIPVPENFHVQTETPKNEKARILFNAGGGSGWSGMLPGADKAELDTHLYEVKKRLPNFETLDDEQRKTVFKRVTAKANEKKYESHLNKYLDAFDNSFGKDNYEVTLLSGPAAPDEYKNTFKRVSKKRPNVVNFVEKVDRTEMPHTIAKHDYFVAAPGSTMAEVAALEGYKPKILAVVPHKKDSFGNHFTHNAEWFKHEFGGIETINLNDKLTTEHITSQLGKLKDKKAPLQHAVRFQGRETDKVLGIIKDDFSRSKKFTSKLMLAGAVGLGALAIKKGLEKNSSLQNFALHSLKDFKGGKVNYALLGLPVGLVGGVVLNAKTKKNSNKIIPPVVGIATGAGAGIAVGAKLPSIIKYLGPSAETTRLFGHVKPYASGAEILEKVKVL